MWPFTSSPPSGTYTEDEIRKALGVPDEEYHQIGALPLPSSSPTNSEIESAQPSFAELIQSPTSRLGILPQFRFGFVLTSTFLTGFLLGAQQGSTIAANRYRAENAHRMPVSKNGWYLYRRSKGYNAFVGGVKQGVRYGGVLSLWAGGFLIVEEGLDRARGRIFAKNEGEVVPGQKDFVNTVSAAMTVAGVYSWVHKLDPWASARTAKLALRFSIPFGLIQDGILAAKGHPPRYLAWFWRKSGFEKREAMI